ncbi:MAG TPA: glycosyltransferase [Acidimicrobiia bacterium]
MEGELSDGGQLARRGAPPADLSVVIPCLNAADVLSRQLDALSSQEWDGSWDVIIADNGSTDATAAIAQSYQGRLPSLRILDASDRRGRQYACNAGARVAGRSIVFVDADDEIAPGYIAAVGKALAEHPIVAARIDDSTLNDGWILESRSGTQSADLQHGLGFLPFGSGGTLGVQNPVFEDLGGFADNMHYAEDVDFCWRAQLAGVPIHFVSDAVVRYRYRPSLRSMYRQHRNFGRASALLYRTYRGRGMPGRATKASLREWWGTSKGLLLIRSRADAARWARRLGRSVGRLQGSAHYRVWYP